MTKNNSNLGQLVYIVNQSILRDGPLNLFSYLGQYCFLVLAKKYKGIWHLHIIINIIYYIILYTHIIL